MLNPKYPQKELLPKFENHVTVPSEGYKLLDQIVDRLNFNNTLFFYSYQNSSIVILCARTTKSINEKFYTASQFEAPLEFLSWFSSALDDYIKPSSQGGLHPGAMTSQDEDVGGEMMCIQRAMDAGNNQQGYIVVNRSRPSRLYHSYNPSEICFAENFLYEGGLLKLIKNLGAKFEQGEL